MDGTIGLIDIVIIVLYILAVMGIGFYFTRKETSSDYFLAGRSVTWWAIGASLFASNISSEHFIGLAGTGAKSGLAVGHFEWQASFCVLTLGWLFVPFYLRSGVFTMPEFLEKRYNAACRWYLTAVSIIAYILTKISVTLIAGSLLLEAVMGWDYITSSLVLVIATGIYTVAGGLSAVIYTEVLQTVVLIGGAIVLTLVGLNEVGGWSGLTAKIDPEFFNMFKAMDHPDFPWTGILFGAPIVGVWYWCTDQFIVQRVLSAKDEDNAKSGAIFAAYLKLLPVFIMVLPGVIAAALYTSDVGDTAYPRLVTDLLPTGLKGIVIAGLLAAIMSSLASCFNSSSTLITMDVYKKLRPAASEQNLVMVGRMFTAVMVFLGILWIPFIQVFGAGLYVYLQSVQAYISPPITACFLFGVLSSRLTGTGAFSSLIAGFILGAFRFTLEILYKSEYALPAPLVWLATINFLHFAIVLFVICTIILYAVSYATLPERREKIRGLTFSTAKEGIPAAAADEQLPGLGERTYWHNINLFFSALVIIIILTLWYIFS
ncbi:MAG: sodium:solute symporter [bacterium]|jgi:SSS family solute:Na+ symporter